MNVLVACEESQEVCKAFRALGHDAYSCDIQQKDLFMAERASSSYADRNCYRSCPVCFQRVLYKNA